MRVFILALSVVGILVSTHVAKAGPSMTDRDLLASADPGTIAQEATQETEDRIGLDKAKRRDVQRRLTGLGFVQCGRAERGPPGALSAFVSSSARQYRSGCHGSDRTPKELTRTALSPR